MALEADISQPKCRYPFSNITLIASILFDNSCNSPPASSPSQKPCRVSFLQTACRE